MICHDFRCTCGAEYEVIFPSSARITRTIPCDSCGKEANLIWKSFGPKGRVGGEKGRYPRYEIQAGRTFNSLAEEKAYLKEKGLERQGPDEYRRSLSQPSNSEPDYSGLRTCMKEAWDETIVHGKEVPHQITGPGFKWIEGQKEDSSG